MESLDMQGLLDFDQTLASLLEKAPEKRRELHEQLAEMAKRELDTAISGSGVNDGRGHIRRYQAKHVGSGGGYAAVRPIGSKEGAPSGPNSPGAITNYLEGGHKLRTPKGNAKRYRPRIRVAYVNGYHFYQSAKTSVDAKAIQLAENFAEQLAAAIEGGGL